MRQRNPYLDLLGRERDFRRVYVSQLLSLGGDWFAVVPLLVLLPTLTGSGLYGSLVLAADTLCFAALAPYAGVVADRFDRRTLMIAADLVSVVFVLLLLLVRSEGTAWIAFVALGGVAAAKAFYSPASSAALPNLVGADDLATASVLSGASWGTMLAVGAAAGGVLAEVLGTDACFVLDAVTFLVSAALTWRTTRPFQTVREDRPRTSVRAGIAEAWAYGRTDSRVPALLACKVGTGLGNGGLSLFPVFAASAFGVGAAGVGLMYSVRGVGALVGPLAMRRSATRERSLYLVLAGSMALFGVAYVAVAFSPVFWVVLVLLVVAHFGGGANWILSAYGLQALVPDEIRGRVFSADFMAATLALAVSQVAAGLLSEVVPVRPLLAGFGLLTLVYAAGWMVATRGIRSRAVDGVLAPVGDPGQGLETGATSDVAKAVLAQAVLAPAGRPRPPESS